MCLDNRAADGQPHAHAGFLCRKEGLEQVGHDIIRNSGAGIKYRNFNHVVGDPGIRGDKLALRRVCHRLERIAKQIDQNLLDLNPINQNQIVLRIEVKAKLDALFAGAGKAKRAGFFESISKDFRRVSPTPRAQRNHEDAE